MPRYYPIFLDVSGLLCVVIGGGIVAERKILGLLDAEARLLVVSPDATQTIRELSALGKIEYMSCAYRPSHLDGAELVFAATNVRAVNAQVAADAAALGLRITVADAPDDGTFIVPSVVRRGDFCLAISTGGGNPMLSGRIADELEARFPPEYADYVELLSAVRDTIKSSVESITARRAAAVAVLDCEHEILTHLTAGRKGEARFAALSAARRAAGVSEIGRLEDS